MFYLCSVTDAVHRQQLNDLTEIAYRLGVAFGVAAERADTDERQVELFKLFDRCFFSVRVGIALELRLRKELATRSAPEREAPEREAPERERPEAGERSDALRYDERDREREVERASLPLLLRTLESVAADAALPGPPPAELPNLRELLAQVRGAEPTPPARPAKPPLRARLTGSATLPPIYESPRLRRATGPPAASSPHAKRKGRG